MSNKYHSTYTLFPGVGGRYLVSHFIRQLIIKSAILLLIVLCGYFVWSMTETYSEWSSSPEEEYSGGDYYNDAPHGIYGIL